MLILNAITRTARRRVKLAIAVRVALNQAQILLVIIIFQHHFYASGKTLRIKQPAKNKISYQSLNEYQFIDGRNF